MNFHFPWFTKPKSQPLRSVVAYRTESLAAQRRKHDVMLSLAVSLAQLSPEERKTAVQRGATVKFETPAEYAKRMEPKIFAGMRTPKLGKGAAE